MDVIEASNKKEFLKINVANLHVDNYNPRFPENVQGKVEKDILKILERDFDLRELADSMSQNGYFDEEPMVAVPAKLPDDFKDDGTGEDWEKFKNFIGRPDTQFIVVEGNRRLSTIKLLLDSSLREQFGISEWPELLPRVKCDLEVVPVYVYPKREKVMPYLGVRHISAVKKWDPFAKSRYIAQMKNNGYSIEQIEQRTGDRQNAARTSYLAYKLVERLEEESAGSTENARKNFSYLLLALGQNPVRSYIGMPRKLSEINLESPVSDDKVDNLKDLFSFLFGEGKEIPPVFTDSRRITDSLVDVLKSPEATKLLKDTRNLQDAYELSGGRQAAVVKKLRTVQNALKYVLPMIRDNINEDISSLVKECESMLDQIKTLIGSATKKS